MAVNENPKPSDVVDMATTIARDAKQETEPFNPAEGASLLIAQLRDEIDFYVGFILDAEMCTAEIPGKPGVTLSKRASAKLNRAHDDVAMGYATIVENHARIAVLSATYGLCPTCGGHEVDATE